MWRRLFNLSFFWLPAIVHVASLSGAVIVTLDDRPPSGAATGGVGVVLEPLDDPRAYSRTVVTNAGDMTFRRTCEASRCELFAGTGGGYTLLASYPADRTVDLRTWPEVEITRIHQPRPPPTPSGTWWIATLFSGVLALSMLGMRLPIERSELERIERGRDALMTEDGELVLDDGRGVCVAEPLPPGPALALHRRVTLAGTPYRGAPEEVWHASPGSKAEHVLRVGAAIGATRIAMISIVCANLAALGTIALLQT